RRSGSRRRHSFLKYYHILTDFCRGWPMPRPSRLRGASTSHSSSFAWLRLISSLPSAIFLLLFPARHPYTVGESVAGLTFLCQQSDIAPSFSRLLRFSSRATLRPDAWGPSPLARYRPRAATPALFLSRGERSSFVREKG